jgi:hypothetical protein
MLLKDPSNAFYSIQGEDSTNNTLYRYYNIDVFEETGHYEFGFYLEKDKVKVWCRRSRGSGIQEASLNTVRNGLGDFLSKTKKSMGDDLFAGVVVSLFDTLEKSQEMWE